MSFTYRNEGDAVILTAESTAAYHDGSQATAVEDLAKRNVEETGRACDVFANDGVTLLVRVRPADLGNASGGGDVPPARGGT